MQDRPGNACVSRIASVLGLIRKAAIEGAMISHALRWASLAILLCLAGCGFVRDGILDGPYRLVAIDTSEDMSLCRSYGTTGDCVGDGLRGPTLFQAGANSRYIVFARHPLMGHGPADRSVTEFYYIARQANESDVLKPVAVSGPFNEVEYLQEKRRLQLPEFSRVFADLK
jgi:hypothetical protein